MILVKSEKLNWDPRTAWFVDPSDQHDSNSRKFDVLVRIDLGITIFKSMAKSTHTGPWFSDLKFFWCRLSFLSHEADFSQWDAKGTFLSTICRICYA